MKAKVIRTALLLYGMLIATMIPVTGITSYAKDNSKVNLGEADSHLKINSVEERRPQNSDSVVNDKTAGETSAGQAAAEESERQLQPDIDSAPAGQHDMPEKKEKQPEKD